MAGYTSYILYGKIVEDCPLVMAAKSKSASIASVTLKLELAKPPQQLEEIEGLEGEIFFKVRWIIEDKSERPERFSFSTRSPQIPKADIKISSNEDSQKLGDETHPSLLAPSAIL